MTDAERLAAFEKLLPTIAVVMRWVVGGPEYDEEAPHAWKLQLLDGTEIGYPRIVAGKILADLPPLLSTSVTNVPNVADEGRLLRRMLRNVGGLTDDEIDYALELARADEKRATAAQEKLPL